MCPSSPGTPSRPGRLAAGLHGPRRSRCRSPPACSRRSRRSRHELARPRPRPDIVLEQRRQARGLGDDVPQRHVTEAEVGGEDRRAPASRRRRPGTTTPTAPWWPLPQAPRSPRAALRRRRRVRPRRGSGTNSRTNLPARSTTAAFDRGAADVDGDHQVLLIGSPEGGRSFHRTAVTADDPALDHREQDDDGNRRDHEPANR